MNQTATENLKELYEKADYIVFDEVKPLTFRIGKDSVELKTLLERYNSQHWAFITAFNPFSQKLSLEENIKRDNLLRKELLNLNLRFIGGIGCDSSGKFWMPEKSVIVFDIDLQTAVNIGRRFEQNAIIFAKRNYVPELVWCTPDYQGEDISPLIEGLFFDSGNLSCKGEKDQFSSIDKSLPIITIQILTDTGALSESIYVRFRETENDPLQFDALTIIYPEPFEFGEIKDACLMLLKQTLRHYSRSIGTQTSMIISTENDIRIFRDKDNDEFLNITNPIGGLTLFTHPRTGTGTFAPLLVEDAPLDLEKSFKISKDGKMIFSNGGGIRFQDVPGVVLNYGYPGTDGAIYSIDFSRESKEWNLYRCRKIQEKGKTFIEIENTGHSLTVDQLNSDHKSVKEIYGVLESVNIYLDGAEVIVLGLPIHNGNF